MKITSITIFFAIVSLLLICFTLSSLKKEKMGIRSGFVWIIMWLSIGFFSLFPSLLDKAMQLAQMENRMFFILLIAIFILFSLVFNMATRIDKMERNIARLVQTITIKEYEISKKS